MDHLPITVGWQPCNSNSRVHFERRATLAVQSGFLFSVAQRRMEDALNAAFDARASSACPPVVPRAFPCHNFWWFFPGTIHLLFSAWLMSGMRSNWRNQVQEFYYGASATSNFWPFCLVFIIIMCFNWLWLFFDGVFETHNNPNETLCLGNILLRA